MITLEELDYVAKISRSYQRSHTMEILDSDVIWAFIVSWAIREELNQVTNDNKIILKKNRILFDGME